MSKKQCNPCDVLFLTPSCVALEGYGVSGKSQLDQEEIYRLTWLALEDETDADDFERLQQLLEKGTSHRKQYVETVNLEAMLQTIYGKQSRSP